MAGYLTEQRVLVTGGSGFLGRAVLERVRAFDPALVAAPASEEYDLRRADDAVRLFDDVDPDLVIHLAARVGGIGANRERPADLYLDNLLMGTYVLDEARRRGTAKTVMIGTICSYPKLAEVPFSEDQLWTGYPEETNAPYGIAKLAQLAQAQANREQYGQDVIYLMPTNLYGPGDKFHASVSHVIPALIKKCVDAHEAGEDHIVVWGTGNASREFLYVDDAADGILQAAERYDGGDPVNLGADEETWIRDLVAPDRRDRRLRRRDPLGQQLTRRPAPPARGSHAGRHRVRLQGKHPPPGRPPRHRGLVPEQPRRGRSEDPVGRSAPTELVLEPLHGAFDALAELDLGLPAELGAGPGDVGPALAWGRRRAGPRRRPPTCCR